MEKTVTSRDRHTPGPVFGRRDPDARGYFGAFGGRFVPETLVAPVEALEAAYFQARSDATFASELIGLLESFVGRPTPLYEARSLAEGAAATSGVPLEGASELSIATWFRVEAAFHDGELRGRARLVRVAPKKDRLVLELPADEAAPGLAAVGRRLAALARDLE